MAASLRDQLGESVKSLSELVDVDAIDNQTGGLDVSFANGRPLVVGDHAYSVDIRTSASGYASLYSEDNEVTDEITGGKLGGELHGRDVMIPGYMQKLDTLAYSLADAVNTQNAKGYDLDGKSGGSFFTPLAGVAGAAAAIQIDPTLAADPRKVAAASNATAGDNGNARSMASLRTASLMPGGTGTLTDGWAELVYQVGQDLSTTKAEQTNRAEIVSQVEALRDSVSGVSLDEEATMMMKFQRGYEANARYFTTINRAIDSLMQMLGT
jgi:flagellar hook-associated protein 1 FlgK